MLCRLDHVADDADDSAQYRRYRSPEQNTRPPALLRCCCSRGRFGIRSPSGRRHPDPDLSSGPRDGSDDGETGLCALINL